MNKWIVVVGILVFVALGLYFFSTFTGNITAGTVMVERIEDEYYRISDFGADILNETEEGVRDVVEVVVNK